MLIAILITIGLFFALAIYCISTGAIDAAVLVFPIMLAVIAIILPNLFSFEDDDIIIKESKEKENKDLTIEWEEIDDDE